jgi:hypothetical protein
VFNPEFCRKFQSAQQFFSAAGESIEGMYAYAGSGRRIGPDL